MIRTALVATLLLMTACEGAKDKAAAGLDKVDKATDKVVGALDGDDLAKQLASAQAAIANNKEPTAECAWFSQTPDGAKAGHLSGAAGEFKQLCSFDAPLIGATRAVVAAEKARAEQPQAPSLTECSSDTWFQVQRTLDQSMYNGVIRWTELKARWAKVCPDAK